MSWIKENSSTILTCFGIAFGITTLGTGIKVTPHAYEKLKNAERRVQRPLTFKEKVRLCGKDYIPTAVAGAASLACTISANVVSRKQCNRVTTAYTALVAIFDNYRNRIRELHDPITDAAAINGAVQQCMDEEDDRPPWDEPQAFYLECIQNGEFFERTANDIFKCEYEFNRFFALKGRVTLDDVCDIFKLDRVPDGDMYGWEEPRPSNVLSYGWIDFERHYITTDDGMTICALRLPFEPKRLSE